MCICRRFHLFTRWFAILWLALVRATIAVAEVEPSGSRPPGGAVSESAWSLHAEGAGRARLDHGDLVLDMAAPAKGKHAWAEFRDALKLPITIEWQQTTTRESPHMYMAGLYVMDAAGHLYTFGLTGPPLGRVAFAWNRRGKRALPQGQSVRFELRIPLSHQAKLTVSTDGKSDRLTTRLGDFRGRLCRIGFYHNQACNQGPDAFAQDRGTSRFSDVRVAAAARRRGPLETYRDADVRGFDIRTPIHFNREMAWVPPRKANTATVLAYDHCGTLSLTGTEAATDWLSNRGCTMTAVTPDTSRFTRPNDIDGADSACVPMFEWCVAQHPVLKYSLRPDGGAVRLVITMPCPFLGRGIELFSTPFSLKPRADVVDLAAAFARRGLAAHQFGEIAVFLEQERGVAGPRSTCDVRLTFPGHAALLTGPPPVRTPQQARTSIVLRTLVVKASGEPARGNEARIVGTVGGRRIALADPDADGIFTARLIGLPVGTHSCRLQATLDGKTLPADLDVTVAPAAFARWKPGAPTYQLPDGTVLPTLLGDLFAWTPVLNPALPGRRIVSNAELWRKLTPEERKSVRLIKLRTLSRAEIATMVRAYAENGVRVLRLTPNVTPHESYLDAGGHASPRGLETLAWVLAECRERGIRVLINLFHYPYWSPGTGRFPPWKQYVDAGYSDASSFFSARTGGLLRGYLADVLAVTAGDPAVLAYSLTGENDQNYSPKWINALTAFIRKKDPNHVVTLEQGGGVLHRSGGVPWSYAEFAPVKSAGLGYRTYYTGGIDSEVYMMICGRAYRSNPPVFMAEVGSGPGWYGAFKTWLHPDFITKVRDAHWMAVLCQHTMSICWSAPWIQAECRVPQRCVEQIDWQRFHRRTPKIGIRVEAVTRRNISKLAAWEKRLSGLALEYDYVWKNVPAGVSRSEHSVVFDLAADPATTTIPEDVLASRLFTVSPGHSTSLLVSERPLQALALIRNSVEHRLGPGYGRGVRERHRQRTRSLPLVLRFGAVPSMGAAFRVVDVNTGSILEFGRASPHMAVDLGSTPHDVAVLILAGSADGRPPQLH